MLSESRSACPNLQLHGLYSPWNYLGQNTGVGSLSLLQGIFPTQGLNPGLLHCRQVLYQLSHKGSPRILEWVAYPFSRRSSWLRNWTRVSCTTGRLFTNWAIRKAHKEYIVVIYIKNYPKRSFLRNYRRLMFSQFHFAFQNRYIGPILKQLKSVNSIHH